MKSRETLRSMTASVNVAPHARSGEPSSPGSSERDVLPLDVGARFGDRDRYQLLSRIGSGGTSVVHVVQDHWLDRRLAGKFSVGEDAYSAVMEDEGRAIARLSHRNIVTVHDIGEVNGIPFLLLELLEGRTLAELIAAEKQLTPLRALRVALAVASALEHAHARGVFHFDLKPGNVHVGYTGAIKLLDFGVGSRRLTALGHASGDADNVVGTPCYMAPEQWNLETLDARTDVWALGMLLYECLTGVLPLAGQHLGFTLARGSSVALGRLSQRLGLPSVLDEIMERTLAVEPGARFCDVSELLTMLEFAERAVLELELAGFSCVERQLCASVMACGGRLELTQLTSVSRLPTATVTLGLARLERRGVLAPAPGRPGRYIVVDESLPQVCLERLSYAERAALLSGVSGELTSRV